MSLIGSTIKKIFKDKIYVTDKLFVSAELIAYLKRLICITFFMDTSTVRHELIYCWELPRRGRRWCGRRRRRC
jgi:hypothetical protein